MTPEEELSNLLRQIEEDSIKALKKNRLTALTFGVLATFALMALVFAFFEQTQAVRAQLEAEKAQWAAERENSALKKQIQIEMEKSQACEKAMIEYQVSYLAEKKSKK